MRGSGPYFKESMDKTNPIASALPHIPLLYQYNLLTKLTLKIIVKRIIKYYTKKTGDRNIPPRKVPGFAKYAVDANLFRLESPILTRAKRATDRNNVGGEVSLQG